jgi:hypothetical protein
MCEACCLLVTIKRTGCKIQLACTLAHADGFQVAGSVIGQRPANLTRMETPKDDVDEHQTQTTIALLFVDYLHHYTNNRRLLLSVSVVPILS